MEFIESNQLLNCTGTIVPAEKAFKNKRIILLYFAGSWCMACKQFLPKLKEIYNKSKQMRLRLEIIYVAMDETDEEEMMKHFTQRHGGWYAVPFADPAIWVLRVVYSISQVPEIVVLGPDGDVISEKGMQDYEKLGMDILVAWNTMPPK